MVKKIVSGVAALSMVFLLTFESIGSVFAAQTSTVSRSSGVKGTYLDSLNIQHCVTGNISCTGTIAWEEGIAGWIVDASFSASAEVDGGGVSLDGSSPMVNNGSSAYRKFYINNSSHYIQGVLTCDEYGQDGLGTSFN